MPRKRKDSWGEFRQGLGVSLVFVLLALALLMGGSRQGATNGVVEACAGLLLAIGCLAGRLDRLSRPGVAGLALLGAAVVVGLLQIIPLPAALWTALPGRAELAEAMTLAGVTPPAAPISLFSDATAFALFGFLPVIAAFTLSASTNLRAHLRVLAFLVAGIAAASVFLGVAQVITGANSEFYLYEVTGRGAPVGLFANQNHQATFCLMALPLLAAKAGDVRVNWETGERDHGKVLILASAAIVATLGVIIAGSVAGYTLLGPVIVASLLILRGSRKGQGGLAAPLVAVVVLGVLGWLAANSPVLTDLGITSLEGGAGSRPDIFARTIEAIWTYFPFGSGVGSFREAYPRFEDVAAVTTTFMNNAHNDYLEVAMEMGLAGMAILVGGLALYAVMSWRAWTKTGSEARLQKAASIALAVPLLHSLVDYPMRAPGLGVLAAVCAGVLVATTHKPSKARDEADGPAHKQLTL